MNNNNFLWRILILISFSMLLHVQAYAQFWQSYRQNNAKGGVKLIYQEFETEDVVPGSSGRNITWDFTTIKKGKNRVVKKITSPDSLAKAEFPEANLIEIHGDSIFTALQEEYGRTYNLGYIDKSAELKIEYPKPLLVSRFPISYLDVISRDYTTFFNLKEQSFSGEGKIKIEADGYGNLRLPDTIYREVTRLRITQKQTDFIEKYDKTHESSTTTFMWFNKGEKHPILILRKMRSGDEIRKEGQYLLKVEDLYKSRNKNQNFFD